ncbi:guanosine-3',5'-bis(diphosphate) 3'-pyrophosphohydrolase [Acinetobacter sp. TGL-Y2]|uniref:HD domain-containing protein n=1 Tax=Acinetobacter sp. TGL-Y2 TaxID=1407071 RepID=UPI0007A66EF6|nr:HD domain-containing protein [Acinetobacter sp. TGL-Y2]AMW79015.1 guanosine-3',5'-bis(diphosphate) 3'-pyrophosphohydrolase [Acinetobacter sp. TGL-Y2]
MSTLEKAIALAANRHAGQVDKAQQPYILHPQRLMLKVKTPNEQIAAVLHDILEDTNTTVIELISLGFSPVVVEAVQALTKKSGETRIKAAYRAVKNPIARAVKLADVADNMDISRIATPTPADFRRLEEYQRVRQILISNEYVADQQSVH